MAYYKLGTAFCGHVISLKELWSFGGEDSISHSRKTRKRKRILLDLQVDAIADNELTYLLSRRKGIHCQCKAAIHKNREV